MGEKLDSFEFLTGPKKKYPWEEWTDGSIWKIQKGEDFTAGVLTLIQSLYHHAKRHGFTVRVSNVGGDAVVFQFTKKPNEEPSDG